MMLHIQVLHLLRNSDNFVAHLRRIQKMGGRRLGVLTAWNEVSRQKCTGNLRTPFPPRLRAYLLLLNQRLTVVCRLKDRLD